MRKSLSLVVVFLLLLSAVSSAWATGLTVLTSLDVTQALGEALTKGTGIEVVNVIPEGYSMQGQDAYLKKHQKDFFKVASTAEAVLTVGSAWPSDPLYKWARRGNIRIVNIDASKPLDEYGAGVPLVEVEGQSSPFVWRSPANLTRMAAIVSDDLCRLSPDDTDVIRDNLRAVQTALFKLRSRYEETFVELDFVELGAFTAGYTYLVDEFGLDVVFYVLAPESRWKDSDVAHIAARLKRDEVKAVICPWEPDARGLKAITDGGAVPVVLDKFKRQAGSDPVESLVDWFDGNLSRLARALNN